MKTFVEGEETQLIQESSGMFPSGDDESTVSAEINEVLCSVAFMPESSSSQAIQHDVNMDAVNDMGNDMGLGESLKSGATSWEKKAAAAVSTPHFMSPSTEFILLIAPRLTQCHARNWLKCSQCRMML